VVTQWMADERDSLVKSLVARDEDQPILKGRIRQLNIILNAIDEARKGVHRGGSSVQRSGLDQ
jgi:hypothetical protein